MDNTNTNNTILSEDNELEINVQTENAIILSNDKILEKIDQIDTNTNDIKTINSEIDTMNDTISNLADGSPKGVFDNVAALVAGNPASGVYLTKDNGHIYSWMKDGTTAVDLGVYQATLLSVYEKDGIDLSYTPYKNGLDRDWVLNTMILHKQSMSLNGNIGPEREDRLRTGRLETSIRGCIASINNSKFMMSVRYYSAKTDPNFVSEYIGYEDWTDKPIYVGKHPVYVLCFKKVDESNFTDEDVLEVRQSLDVYSFTDKSLTKEGVPADSKVVGDLLLKKPYESGMIHFNINVNSNVLVNNSVDNEVSDEVLGVLMLPTNYSPIGKQIPIICMCHGASGVITDTIWYNDNWLNLAQAYLNAGFAVFDTNRTNSGLDGYGKTYGSPISVEALYKAYQYIKENYNVENKLFLHGTSMGGTTAQSFVYTYPNLVKACVCFAPANTLYSIWRSGISLRNETDANLITKCFGYETREAAKADGYKNLIGHVTALRIKRFNNSGVLIKSNIEDIENAIEENSNGGFWHNENEDWYLDFPVPIKIFMGTNDTSVEQSFNECLIKAIRNAGGIAYLKLIEGGTHTQVSYGLTDNTQNEAIMFFNRFR